MKNAKFNVLEAIGNTPLIKVGNVYAKLESVNPSGSIKDRVALEIIEAAEREGKLRKGYTIVEASSGNTGISLSMCAAIKGYKMIVVMPENMSEERMQIIKALGAELVLTSKSGSLQEAIEKAEEKKAKAEEVKVEEPKAEAPAEPTPAKAAKKGKGRKK